MFAVESVRFDLELCSGYFELLGNIDNLRVGQGEMWTLEANKCSGFDTNLWLKSHETKDGGDAINVSNLKRHSHTKFSFSVAALKN